MHESSDLLYPLPYVAAYFLNHRHKLASVQLHTCPSRTFPFVVLAESYEGFDSQMSWVFCNHRPVYLMICWFRRKKILFIDDFYCPFYWQLKHCGSLVLKPIFWPSCNSVCLEKWFSCTALGKHYVLYIFVVWIRTKIGWLLTEASTDVFCSQTQGVSCWFHSIIGH